MNNFYCAVTIDEQRCKGCNLCSEACKQGIIRLGDKVNSKGYAFAELTDWQRCTGCMSCAIICPDACITVFRRRI